MGTVYLLHFCDNEGNTKRYRHALHYCGFTSKEKLEDRLDRHRSGQGARLIQVIIEAGLTFKVARVWKNVKRIEERKLKRMGGFSRLCPLCKEEKKSCARA